MRATVLAAVLVCGQVQAHQESLRGVVPLAVHNEWVASLAGVREFFPPAPIMAMEIEGRQCVRGAAFAVDIRDSVAFDIDETVQLEFDLQVATSYPAIGILYDRNAPQRRDNQLIGNGLGVAATGIPTTAGDWYRARVSLDRARFAGLGPDRSDLLVVAMPRPDVSTQLAPILTLCDLRILRSHTTPSLQSTGGLTLLIGDKTGTAVPARLGLYDETGKTPLPSDDALIVKWGESERRLVEITPGLKGPWPSENIRIFYTDGVYNAQVPEGRYRLLVSRGMEYELLDQSFEILADTQTTLDLRPDQLLPMAERGWFSGDTHLHISRASPADNQRIINHLRAEGLHVGHLLEMGDIASTHFKQYQWGAAGEYHRHDTVLIPGQEDPRSARLGHVLGLQVTDQVRDTDRYYLYNEVLRGLRAQGSLVGYAHLDRNHAPSSRTNPVTGLALDVPAGLVDFVELMSGSDQRGGLWMSSAWFDFLNLGYKLSVTAGSDYMDNANIPGAARTYVYLGPNRKFSADNWMASLHAGRSFATTGPMLDFQVNGQLPGSEVALSRGDLINVRVTAEINPHVDMLERLQIYSQGELVKEVVAEQGTIKLTLAHTEKATSGAWFVAIALGKGNSHGAVARAATSPVYVNVDNTGFCNPAVVPEAAKSMQNVLKRALAMTVDALSDVRPWVTLEKRHQVWQENRSEVVDRVNAANTEYSRMVALASEGRCQ